MKACVVLEDGSTFEGVSVSGDFGEEKFGPVIIDTAVVGYQEMMTDTSNCGKILVLTYPLIGNYGVNKKFNESNKVWISALVMKEKSNIYSNFQAEESLDKFLARQKVLALSEVDTRTLATTIRDKGEMWGAVTTNKKSILEKIGKAKKGEDVEDARGTPQGSSTRQGKKKSFLKKISTGEITTLSGGGKIKKKILIIDIGISQSFIDQLLKSGCKIIRAPYNISVSKILELKPDGIVISNGPEEDPGLEEVVRNVKDLIGKFPILGISTGHEVIAKAVGGKLSKLKIGHHGVNYPVINPGKFKGEITVQNHSWIVDKDSIDKIKDLEIIEVNLNDKSIEKMRSKNLKLISVQYYPVSPGFKEVNPVFKEFLDT